MPAAAAREVELKLHVARADLERIARLPAVLAAADGEASVRRLRTVYFDTPDLRLFTAGVALRIRSGGDGFVQAVKMVKDSASGDSAGVAVRHEWEWPIPDDGPDLSLLDADGIAALVPAETRGTLVPVFSTDVRRTAILVRPDALTAIEIALDEGDIAVGSTRTPISEVELELKSGRIGSLFGLARRLQQAVPMRIGTESKAEVGYRLVAGRPPQPVLPDPPGLSSATTVAEAFRHILRHGLGQILANEPCALAGGDVEGLHQMRVALRRLRTAMKLFAPVVGVPEPAGLHDDLRWLTRRLGPARGWDVLLSGVLLPAMASGKAPGGLRELIAAARQARLGPAEKAVSAIEDPRCTGFLLALGAWLEEGRWYADAAPERRALLDRPIAALAGGWLDRRLRKARKAGRDFDRLDTAGRETLRRRLRKLGYTVYFFQGLYPPAREQNFTAPLAALIDALDSEHDAAVARKLLPPLIGREAPTRRSAGNRLLHRLERQDERDRRAMPALWKAFRDAEAFW